MPTVFSAWTPNGSTNQRMRLRVDYTVPTPSAGQTSVTVTGSVHVEVRYSVNDQNNSFSMGGTLGPSASGSRPFNVPTDGSRQLQTFSQTVSLGSSPATRTLTASLTGVEYVGISQTARVTANITIPARVAVNAPTNVRTVRVSNTRLRITWSGGAVHDVQVRRLQTPGGNQHDWRDWERLGSQGTARNSGVEYDVQTGYEWQARVRRQAGSAWSSWASATTRARLFELPDGRVRDAVATRSSDTRHTIRWTRDTLAHRPIVSIEVERWTQLSDTWNSAATLAGTVSSWVDTRNLDNNRIRWRVRARNAAGTSAWIYTDFTFTAPAAPTNTTASRTGPAQALVSWTIEARYGQTQKLQQRTRPQEGGTWSEWEDVAGHTSFSGTLTQRTVTGLDADLEYQFRPVVMVPNPALSATGPASNSVRPAAPPNAPVILGPVGVVSSQEDTLLRWRHNPTDASNQTEFEIQWRVNGAGSWEDGSGGGQQTYDLGELPANTYEWRARTRGTHANFGPWSPAAVFEVANPPVVVITTPSPDGVVESNVVRLEWAYDDPEGAQAGWSALLLADAGDELEAVSGTDETSHTFRTTLDDLTDYRIELQVRSGTGLPSATVEARFTVVYLPPEKAALAAEWNEPGGVVSLTVADFPGAGYSYVGGASSSESVMTRDDQVVAINRAINSSFEAIEAPILGNIALIGDSLLEGLAFTPDFAETVGQKLLPHAEKPARYWLAPTGHGGMLFQNSEITGTYTMSPSGVPYSGILAQGGRIRWQLDPAIAEARVAFRRGSFITGGIADSEAIILTANGPISFSGPTTDPAGFGTDIVAVQNPGSWIELQATGGPVEAVGVEVHVQGGERAHGAGVYVFAASGWDSGNLEHATHQWRVLTPYMRTKLGVTTVVTQIGVNDSIQSTPVATFKARFQAAATQLAAGGITDFRAILMPDSGGVSGDMTPYRTALQELADDNVLTLIDARDMPLRQGIEVGIDGLHWLPAGNQAFVDAVWAPLAGVDDPSGVRPPVGYDVGVPSNEWSSSGEYSLRITDEPLEIDLRDQTLLVRGRSSSQPVTLEGSTRRPFEGSFFVFGDSLIEGMLYTPMWEQAVGQRFREQGAARPQRYWINAGSDTRVAFETSSVHLGSVDRAYNGVPWSHFRDIGEHTQWPLRDNPARVEVYFRRDNGTSWHEGLVEVTSQSGATESLDGPTLNPDFGLDHIVIDNPGSWVRIEPKTVGRIQIIGVHVHQVVGEGGSGAYFSGQSGLDSHWFADQLHQWRSFNPLIRYRLGVTHVVTQISTNDQALGTTPAQFKDDLRDARTKLLAGGITTFTAVLMPGTALAPYRQALQELQTEGVVDHLIDATMMPRTEREIGQDGTHWTPEGNQEFANILAEHFSEEIPSTTALQGDWEANGWYRVYGTGKVSLGTGWWDDLLIVDGRYEGRYFNGGMPNTTDTEYNRIERSENQGETWHVVGDNLPLNVGLDDWMVPLNQIAWYRAVAVSEWGTEAPSEHMEVETVTERLWLNAADIDPVYVIGNLSLAPQLGHERVSEQYYGRTLPVAHYGQARPVTVAVTADQAHGRGIEVDWSGPLGRDVWYRDPTGRAMWSSILSDGVSLPQSSKYLRGVSFTVEAVDVEA